MPRAKSVDINNNTRERLVDLGHIMKKDKVKAIVLSHVEDDLSYEIIEFKSGQRLIKVEPNPDTSDAKPTRTIPVS